MERTHVSYPMGLFFPPKLSSSHLWLFKMMTQHLLFEFIRVHLCCLHIFSQLVCVTMMSSCHAVLWKKLGCVTCVPNGHCTSWIRHLPQHSAPFQSSSQGKPLCVYSEMHRSLSSVRSYSRRPQTPPPSLPPSTLLHLSA